MEQGWWEDLGCSKFTSRER